MTLPFDLWLMAKDVAVANTGLSRPALHVAFGTGLFALLLLGSTGRRSGMRAWWVVAALELANEAIDQQHLLAIGGALDGAASWRDIVDTMMVPTLVLFWRHAWRDRRYGYRRGRSRHAASSNHQVANTLRTASRSA